MTYLIMKPLEIYVNFILLYDFVKCFQLREFDINFVTATILTYLYKFLSVWSTEIPTCHITVPIHGAYTRGAVARIANFEFNYFLVKTVFS